MGKDREYDGTETVETNAGDDATQGTVADQDPQVTEQDKEGQKRAEKQMKEQES